MSSLYLILDLPNDFDFDEVDAKLFHAGVEGFAQTAGYPVVRWEFSEPSLMGAAKRAIAELEAAGFSVARVESEESFALRCLNERLENRRTFAPQAD